MNAKITKIHMSQRILQALWGSDYPPVSGHHEVKRVSRRSRSHLERLYAQAMEMLSQEQLSHTPEED